MYQDFARVYDKLQDINYADFLSFYNEIFKKYGKSPKLVLDIGCGTGSITIPMSKQGYDMIGLDLSCEMLDVARERSQNEGCDILFLNQNMREMELYGTVDAMVSALDGVNYITEEKDLKQFFKLVDNYLNPGGIFIFDLSTRHKLENILGKNTYVFDEEDVFWTWQSEFDKETKLCEMYLNFFCENEDGTYERFDEYQLQRAYSKEEIEEALKGTSLILAEVCPPFSFSTPSDTDERNFFVILKKMC